MRSAGGDDEASYSRAAFQSAMEDFRTRLRRHARLLAVCGGEVPADPPPGARARRTTPGPDLEVALALSRDRDAGVRRLARAALNDMARRPRPALAIATFGGLRLLRGGQPLGERAVRARGRALLASLLCARGPVHRERLLAWHWPNLPADRGLASLHTTLSELRRALEPGLARGDASALLLTQGESYRLAPRPEDRIDAYELLALGRPDPAPGEDRAALIARLGRAVALAEGEFLPEWPYAEWAEPMRRALAGTHERALEALGAALLEAARPCQAVPVLERLLDLDPEREAACRALMRAHEAGGEPARALRRYHVLRAALRRSGLEPGPETRALYLRILRRGDWRQAEATPGRSSAVKGRRA